MAARGNPMVWAWILLGVAVVPTAPLSAQVTWERDPFIVARSGHALALDAARGRVVLFGGISNNRVELADTWEWDGSSWTSAATVGPASRSGHAMAFDPVRRRTVLFGGATGTTGTSLGDTWEWDGAAWLRRAPAMAPAARSGHAMAWDGVRGRILLFGGGEFAGGGDTWAWDGSTWTQLTPPLAPAARREHRMVEDAARGRIVLFGGVAPSVFLGDTWEWDGSTWTERRSPATAPWPRYLHAMAFDARRGVVVLFGGRPILYDDTWEWDGRAWTQRAVAGQPGARSAHAMAFDPSRGKVVSFGGSDGLSPRADTWAWDGNEWSQPAYTGRPPVREAHGASYDAARGRVVLFGGANTYFEFPAFLQDTWEWDGHAWRQYHPAVRPAARAGHAMAYDARRARTVLFGGGAFTALADTWEWDGTGWTQLFPTTAPAPRFSHAMAFDPLRGEIVLFGGDLSMETWTFAGAQWVPRTPRNSPPARSLSALAWDAARGRIVLFGGYGFGRLLADTWEWDGNDWQQRRPATAPPARFGHALTYDAVRERVVLFAGSSDLNGTGIPLADTWEWDGNSWRQRQVAAPNPRRGHTLVAHDGVERVMMFGGGFGNGHAGTKVLWPETWTYFARSPATWTRLGSGCPGTAGVPELASAGGRRPWLGDPFTLELSRLVPGSPAAIGLGGSKTRWHGLALPFELSVIGMPGCTVFVALDVIAPVANPAGIATLTLPLCLCPELLGLEFFAQGVLLDPAANRLGLVVSNAGEGRIAAR